MRIFGTLIIVVALIVGAYFLFFKKSESGTPREKPSALAVGQHSDIFNGSYNDMLSAYYALRDALVEGDTTKVNAAAGLLSIAADSLETDEIKKDTTGTIGQLAADYASNIKGSATSLMGQTALEEKRRDFQMISNTLWDLTRIVKYDGHKLYKLYCPMAFDNTGAEWLSADTTVFNPYFGQKMLHCGSVRDSLDYAAN